MSRAPNSPPNTEAVPAWGDSRAEQAAPATLGGYRLLDLLAEGEHYRVHRARATGISDTDVVIKCLRASQDRPSRARLLREARLGLGLRDRHLVRVLALHDEPELYLVTELVQGATLEQLLRAPLGMDALRFVLPLLVDVLHGLSALHQWRNEEGAPTYLVHQAIRARHILAGDDGVARLIDLGDVHGSPHSGSAPLLARHDDIEQYAPEQFDASQGLDPRCDVFLAGVVLRDVLARFQVVRGASWSALHAVAERASAPKRSARFWSAEEMAFTLQNAAIEAGVFAPRPAIGAWVQAVRAGVTSDSSRSSGVRPRVAAEPALAAVVSAPAASDDDELGFDTKTTAWERPLDPSSLPADLQALLLDDAEAVPAPASPPPPAGPRVATRRPPPARAPSSAASPSAAPTLAMIRETPNTGSLRRWVGLVALVGVGFGLAALGLRAPRSTPVQPAQPADAEEQSAEAVAPTAVDTPGAAALPASAPVVSPEPAPSVAAAVPTASPEPVPSAERSRPTRAEAANIGEAAKQAAVRPAPAEPSGATQAGAAPSPKLPGNPY